MIRFRIGTFADLASYPWGIPVPHALPQSETICFRQWPDSSFLIQMVQAGSQNGDRSRALGSQRSG